MFQDYAFVKIGAAIAALAISFLIITIIGKVQAALGKSNSHSQAVTKENAQKCA